MDAIESQQFELLPTGNLDPSQAPACGGELMRTRFGGCDLLYEETAEEVIRNINSHDRLTLHYSAQGKSDVLTSAVLQAAVWLVPLGIGALILAAMVADVSRDAGRWLLPCVLLPGALLGAVYKGAKYKTEHLNHIWISQKVIDFVERRLVLSICLPGRFPEQRVTRVDFSEVTLVCYVNHFWEGDPTIDLMLVLNSDLKNAKHISECSRVAHIYRGDTERIENHVCTWKIPAHVQEVADALVGRTGIVLRDDVSRQGYVRKKKPKATSPKDGAKIAWVIAKSDGNRTIYLGISTTDHSYWSFSYGSRAGIKPATGDEAKELDGLRASWESSGAKVGDYAHG